MGRNLFMTCACGDARASFSRAFEYDVLKDGLDALRRARVPLPPVPWGPHGEPDLIPAARLASWVGTAWGRMRADRAALPVLHAIWLRNPGGGMGSAWALLTADGQGWRVSADDNRELAALALEAGRFDAIAALHRLPVVRADGRWPPPTTPARHEPGAWAIAPALLRALFAGTDYVLQSGDVLEFHADAFAQLRALARHAARCGRTIVADFA